MKKELLVALAWGCVILPVAFAAKYAHARGYIDADTMLRIVIALNGLLVAFYGNRIPKAFVPNANARKAKRFAGWALVLSGLTYTGLWIFAPIPLAQAVGTGAIAGAIILTFLYCLALRTPPAANA